MSIFDSHCHPQMEQYDSDREEMLKRAREAGVSMICVGTDFQTSKNGIELAEKHENMWASVGLHPNDLFEELPASPAGRRIADFELLLKQEKVVAMGEVGLDYYRTPEPEKQKMQRDTFEQFIDLAQRVKKPMILHFRDSQKGSSGHVHKDALEILNSQSVIRNGLIGAVAHSFTGSVDDAREYLNLGFRLGFNGILTFARQYDEVVKYAPLDMILLETDSPFLSPEPYRGRRNEPAHIVEVAKKISELRGEPLEKIIGQTTRNCQVLFSLI